MGSALSEKKNEKWFALYLAFTVSILLTAKVYLYNQCYSFDTNDDVNHTFVNLKAAQDILRQGALPEINLYNNFGTPLLGDALTFPFSLHSITYWLFPGPVAMTLNRGIIGFLTILILFLFLRRFLSQLSALVCSLVVFFSPGHFWNLAHHHYQMALLCVVSILYVQARHKDLDRGIYLLLLWIGYLVLFLSVSIQPVTLSIPFLLLFLPLQDGRNAIKAWLLNGVALFSACIATLPHTLVFFKNISGSTRAQWSPYSGIFTSLREQLLTLFIPAGEWMPFYVNGHFSIATYFSIALLVFATIGVLFLTWNKESKAQRPLRLILVLGLIPATGGYWLQFYGQKIPLVRSVDSTRVWWFSNVFLVLAVGMLLDASWKRTVPRTFQFLLGAGALGIVSVYFLLPYLIPEFSEIPMIHRTVILGTAITLFAILTPRRFWQDAGFAVGKVLMVGVLLLALVPTLVLVLGFNIRSCEKGNHYFGYAQEGTFQPSSLLNRMEPGYRMASNEYPSAGHDLKAIFGGVLGSDARAIVSSQKLMETLNRLKLIQLDDNYFFSPPWQTEKLSRLGIRYVLEKQRSSDLEAQSWRLIANAQHLEQKYFLYENPNRPSLVYLLQSTKPSFLRSYQIVPNGIKIQLPELKSEGNLVVTFFHRDGWRAWVDGHKVIPIADDLGMMRVPVEPGNRTVLLHFQRLKGQYFLFSFLGSIVILLLVYFAPHLLPQWSKEWV